MDTECVLLIQTSENLNSRFYLNYSNQHDIIIALFELYEQLLRKKNPDTKCMTYTLEDVVKFVDNLYEVVLLEYDRETKGFRPHGKTWLKSLLQLDIIAA